MTKEEIFDNCTISIKDKVGKHIILKSLKDLHVNY